MSHLTSSPHLASRMPICFPPSLSPPPPPLTAQTNEGVPQEIRLLGSDDKEPVLVVTGKKFRYYNPKSFIEQNGYVLPPARQHAGLPFLFLSPSLLHFGLTERSSPYRQEWRQFDVEPTNLPESLHELPVRFEPSYAYAEEVDQPRGFLIKRCPAWCDRILMTQAALDKALKTIGSYDLIGREVCMGDHKVGSADGRARAVPRWEKPERCAGGAPRARLAWASRRPCLHLTLTPALLLPPPPQPVKLTTGL